MNNLWTVHTDVFKKSWGHITAALRGYKPVRNYESFVLLESDAQTQTITLRVANDLGGLRLQLADVVVSQGMQLAIDVALISRILPFMPGATLEICESEDRRDQLIWSSGNITQYVEHIPKIAEDFPGEGHYTMPEQMRFQCPDFSRRLRLASSSASRDSKAAGLLKASVCLSAPEGMLTLESAHDVRGLSRMRWRPEGPKLQDFRWSFMVECADVLERITSGYDGDIVVSGDPGGGTIAWQIGSITYVCRILGDDWPHRSGIERLYAGTDIAQASVPSQELSTILGLIRAQAPDSASAKALLTMCEDGYVEIESRSGAALGRARMPGLCSGTLPQTITLNAGQVADILSDLKRGSLVHLFAYKPENGVLLRIQAPSDPDFTHLAIPFVIKDMPARNTKSEE